MPFAGQPFAGEPFAGQLSGPGNATNTGFAGQPFAGEQGPVGRILGPAGLLLLLLRPMADLSPEEQEAVERFQETGEWRLEDLGQVVPGEG